MEMGKEAEPGQPQPRAPGKKRNQYIGCFTVSMFALCMGSFMGWTSAASTLTSGSDSVTVTSAEYSWIGALMPLGAMCSALPTGTMAQMLGRKRTLMVLVPVLVAAWLLIICANATWMYMAGRFIGGAVVGSISLVAPMYVAEVPESSLTSTVGTYFQLLHTIGVLFAYVLAASISKLMWISLIIACIPIVVSILFFPFFPDTPRWYLYKGRLEEARKALIFYRGEEYDVDSEINEILAALKKEEEEKIQCMEAFKTPCVRNMSGLVAAIIVALVSQLSGVSAVIFYASDIFESAGSSLSGDLASITMGACLVAGTALATVLSNFVGVRMLLHISGLSCVVCNLVLGIYLYLLAKDGSESLSSWGWLPILTMSAFMILFSIGYGPIPWTYMSNVLANNVKGVMMPIANIMFWLSVFVTTKFYSDLSDAIGDYSTFWIFGGIVLLGAVFVYFYVLELKGKTPEQIQDDLARRYKEGAGLV